MPGPNPGEQAALTGSDNRFDKRTPTKGALFFPFIEHVLLRLSKYVSSPIQRVTEASCQRKHGFIKAKMWSQTKVGTAGSLGQGKQGGYAGRWLQEVGTQR